MSTWSPKETKESVCYRATAQQEKMIMVGFGSRFVSDSPKHVNNSLKTRYGDSFARQLDGRMDVGSDSSSEMKHEWEPRVT